MDRGFDWISTTEWLVLINIGWALILIGVAFLLYERGNGWKRRAQDAAAEATDARVALAAARYQPDARTRPVPVAQWPAPAPVPRPERRYWTARLGWPGTSPAQLPIDYGDAEPPLEALDPCLAAPPDNETLTAWLAEDQPQSWPPLDREGLMVERLITTLEHHDPDDTEPFRALTLIGGGK